MRPIHAHSFSLRPLIAAALLAVVAGAALAHGGDGSTSANTAAISTSQTSAFAGTHGGLSISGAFNAQHAATGGSAVGTGAALGPLSGSMSAVNGTAATSGISAAGNLSIGNANGAAAASGVSTSSIQGAATGHTTGHGPATTATGNAETITGTGAASGSNGFGLSTGSAVAGYDAAASASLIKIGPFQTTDVSSHGVSAAATTPGVQLHIGTGTVTIQNEAAANAFGQAKVGSVVSTN